MNTFKGRPITGSRPSYSKKKPYVPSEDSADAQRLIKEPPAPFKNRMTAAQMPAPVNPNFRADSRFEKDTLSRVKVSTHSLRDGVQVSHGAVGYPNGPYTSRNGINSINSGNPTRGNQRAAGRIATSVGPQVSNRDAIQNGKYVHETGSDLKTAKRRYKDAFGMGLS